MDATTTHRILKVFQIHKLHEYQEKILANLLHGRDAFLSCKTGGDKYLCFQAFPIAWQNTHHQSKCIVLVVAPLIAIMKEQVSFLKLHGFRATYIGEEGVQDEEILNGEYDFVFAAPETIVGMSKWRDMVLSPIYQEKLHLIAVDLSHTVLSWGEKKKDSEAFHSWFAHIGELRSLATKVPFLVMTATTSTLARHKIKTKLALHCPLEIVESPDWPNIKLHLHKVNSCSKPEETFAWLIDMLNEGRLTCIRVIIFCNTIKDCSRVYTAFAMNIDANLRSTYQMYHSMTEESVKETIRADMMSEKGPVRILICTNSAVMGVNFVGVNNVINYGPPHDMDTFVQQFGRAGRSGQPASALLLFSFQQLRNVDTEMLKYVRNEDQCRRTVILHHYNQAPFTITGHECCDICTQTCSCCDACPQNLHPLLSYEDDDESDNSINIVPFSAREKEMVLNILQTYKGTLDMQQGGLQGELPHGFTDKTIELIVNYGHSISSPDDLIEKCQVWSFQQALDVMKELGNIISGSSQSEWQEYLDVDDDL